MADMSGGGHVGDDALLDALRGLAQQEDPVPGEVVLAARSAFAYRRLDAELAELVRDTSDEVKELLAVRSPVAYARLLTFEASGTIIEVEVDAHAGQLRLLGQLVPAQPAAVEVRHTGGTLAVTADEVGRFRAVGIGPGPLSLRCRLAGGQTVETSWVTV